mmetsp:Transcript_22695/g.26055  ORF Transcript_22695/g.26055 Transcript_22695/m.26055 type:complete len:226 (-) Transcript_22695:61-738(-)
MIRKNARGRNGRSSRRNSKRKLRRTKQTIRPMRRTMRSSTMNAWVLSRRRRMTILLMSSRLSTPDFPTLRSMTCFRGSPKPKSGTISSQMTEISSFASASPSLRERKCTRSSERRSRSLLVRTVTATTTSRSSSESCSTASLRRSQSRKCNRSSKTSTKNSRRKRRTKRTRRRLKRKFLTRSPKTKSRKWAAHSRETTRSAKPMMFYFKMTTREKEITGMKEIPM